MKNQFTIEHIRGKYVIASILIPIIIGTPVAYYFTKSSDKGMSITKSNAVKAKEFKNSPIANDIGTQNNYYAVSDTIKKAAPVGLTQPAIITRVVYKEKPVPVDITPKQSTTINADHALIVTNGQTGGINTVNVNTPKPTFSKTTDSVNVRVTKIADLFDTRLLGNTPKPETVFYKSQVTVDYRCQSPINGMGFLINKKDVIHMRVIHNGYSHTRSGLYSGFPYQSFIQPEIGRYTLIIYTLNVVGDLASDVTILQ